MFAVYLNIIVWLVVKEYETYSAWNKEANEIIPVRASFNSTSSQKLWSILDEEKLLSNLNVTAPGRLSLENELFFSVVPYRFTSILFIMRKRVKTNRE